MGRINKLIFALWLYFSPLILHFQTAFPNSGGVKPRQRFDRLLFVGSRHWIPFQFVNEEGSPDGYGVEIVKALCRELDLRCDIVLYDEWEKALEEVASGRAEATVGFMKTLGRSSEYDLSHPIVRVNSVIAVRSDSRGISSIEDLSGTAVAAVPGSPDYYFLKGAGNVRVIGVSGQERGLKMLAEGKAAAYVGTDLSIRYAVKLYNLQNIKIVGRPLAGREYVIGVAKGDSELLGKINGGLAALEKKNTIDKIYTKWFGQDLRIAKLRAWGIRFLYGLLFLSSVAIGAVLALVHFNRRLEKTVRSKTVELAEINRLVVLLSECEKVLIYSKCESELLSKLCSAVVGTGGYDSAWIGFSDGKDGGAIRRAASAGLQEYRTQHRSREPDDAFEDRGGICRGHMQTVLRTGKPYVCRGVGKSSETRSASIFACYMLPISMNDRPIGVFRVCSAVADAFNGKEVFFLDEISGYIAVGINKIRTEKRLESLLQALEEKNKLLMDIGNFMQDGFVIADPEGVLMSVNQSFRGMTGFSEEEVVGKRPPYPFWPPEEHPHLMDLYLEAQTASSKNFELVFIRKNGERFPVMFAPTTIRDKRGKAVVHFATIKDITAQRKREELLRAKGEELSTIITSTPTAIVMLDTEGKVRMWNPAAEKMFGWTASEIIGKPYPLAPGSRAAQIADEIARLARNEPIDVEETQRMTKEGVLLYVHITAAPIHGADGRVTGFIEVISDITRRKNDERKLIESRRRLQEYAVHVQRISEDEKRRISLELHDDLAQTLAALVMELAALSDTLEDEKKDARLAAVKKELSALKHITHQAVRSLRRTISEMRPDTLERLGLVEAIHWQLKEFQEKTGISCESDVGVEAIEIEKDRALSVYRVVQEALSNVARHAVAKRVRLSLHRSNHRYDLRITDDGVGFVPGSEEGKNTFGILGMRERAEALGGALTVESAPGCGTTVKLLFLSG